MSLLLSFLFHLQRSFGLHGARLCICRIYVLASTSLWEWYKKKKTYLQRECPQGWDGHQGSHEERNHVVYGSQSHTCAGATQAVSCPLLHAKTQMSQKRKGEETKREEGSVEEIFKSTLKGILLPASVKEWANRNMSSTPIPSARKGSTWDGKRISGGQKGQNEHLKKVDIKFWALNQRNYPPHILLRSHCPLN